MATLRAHTCAAAGTDAGAAPASRRMLSMPVATAELFQDHLHRPAVDWPPSFAPGTFLMTPKQHRT
jgi:hypothetical protein